MEELSFENAQLYAQFESKSYKKKVSSECAIKIIVPTFNEEKNIADIIEELQRAGYNDILVVDGNSTDYTVEYAKKMGAEVLLQNGKGKGNALRQAFSNSQFKDEVVVIIDADGSMDPEEIPRFIEAVNAGADVVKGSRFLPSGGSEDFTKMRRLGNRILTGVSNFLFLSKYTDLCYGFMAFRKEALAKLTDHLTSDNFEIETEICVKAKLLGLDVREVPSFEHSRHFGKSNLHTFRDGFKIMGLMLKEAFKPESAFDF